MFGLLFDAAQANTQYSKDLCVPGEDGYAFVISDADGSIDNPEGVFDYSVIYDGEVVNENDVFDDDYYTVQFGNDCSAR